MLVTKHAPRGPCRLLERRHGLAEIVKRGAGVLVERLPVNPPTLDDLREAVTTLKELERTARRTLGGAHPKTELIEQYLQDARAALRAREATPPSA